MDKIIAYKDIAGVWHAMIRTGEFTTQEGEGTSLSAAVYDLLIHKMQTYEVVTVQNKLMAELYGK